MPVAPQPIASMQDQVGREIGVSPWIAIEQDRIALFARATDDFNAVHLNAGAAQAFGMADTFAQGFLTLSMLMKLQEDVVPEPADLKAGYNYGLERVRFLSPVMRGARIRGRFRLLALEAVRPGAWRRTLGVAIEIEGQDKPALSAEWIGYYLV